jgi:hypothetical protein
LTDARRDSPRRRLLAAPAAAQEVRDALEARDLICEFRNPFQRDLVADLLDARPPAT